MIVSQQKEAERKSQEVKQKLEEEMLMHKQELQNEKRRREMAEQARADAERAKQEAERKHHALLQAQSMAIGTFRTDVNIIIDDLKLMKYINDGPTLEPLYEKLRQALQDNIQHLNFIKSDEKIPPLHACLRLTHRNVDANVFERMEALIFYTNSLIADYVRTYLNPSYHLVHPDLFAGGKAAFKNFTNGEMPLLTHCYKAIEKAALTIEAAEGFASYSRIVNDLILDLNSINSSLSALEALIGIGKDRPSMIPDDLFGCFKEANGSIPEGRKFKEATKTLQVQLYKLAFSITAQESGASKVKPPNRDLFYTKVPAANISEDLKRLSQFLGSIDTGTSTQTFEYFERELNEFESQKFPEVLKLIGNEANRRQFIEKFNDLKNFIKEADRSSPDFIKNAANLLRELLKFPVSKFDPDSQKLLETLEDTAKDSAKLTFDGFKKEFQKFEENELLKSLERFEDLDQLKDFEGKFNVQKKKVEEIKEPYLAEQAEFIQNATNSLAALQVATTQAFFNPIISNLCQFYRKRINNLESAKKTLSDLFVAIEKSQCSAASKGDKIGDLTAFYKRDINGVIKEFEKASMLLSTEKETYDKLQTIKEAVKNHSILLAALTSLEKIWKKVKADVPLIDKNIQIVDDLVARFKRQDGNYLILSENDRAGCFQHALKALGEDDSRNNPLKNEIKKKLLEVHEAYKSTRDSIIKIKTEYSYNSNSKYYDIKGFNFDATPSTSSGTLSSSSDSSVSPSSNVPIAPPMGDSALDVPIAPPIGDSALDVPIAPPMGDSALDVPIAPPMGDSALDIPIAPPMGDSALDVPIAPSMGDSALDIPIAPPMGDSALDVPIAPPINASFAVNAAIPPTSLDPKEIEKQNRDKWNALSHTKKKDLWTNLYNTAEDIARKKGIAAKTIEEKLTGLVKSRTEYFDDLADVTYDAVKAALESALGQTITPAS